MHHFGHCGAYSASDIEKALDRLALAIQAHGERGRKLLPIYEALEAELESIRAEEATMRNVMARLDRLNA